MRPILNGVRVERPSIRSLCLMDIRFVCVLKAPTRYSSLGPTVQFGAFLILLPKPYIRLKIFQIFSYITHYTKIASEIIRVLRWFRRSCLL